MNKIAAGLAGITLLGGLVTSGTILSPASATTAECTGHDVAVRYHHTDDGAGHRYGRIVMKNVSDHVCRTGGFGGLSYVGFGDGTQVGAAADRVGHASRFTLRPGQRATSRVDEVDAHNYPRHRCSPHAVDGFRVYIPNATASLYIPHPTTGCLDSDVHLLSHRAFRKR
jgi:hypothetical protein